MTEGALRGVRAVTLAVNVPGPAAAARLRWLGASVTKIEPLEGDPLAAFAPSWYARLRAGQDLLALDLKSSQGRESLDRVLGAADLLLTSHRPSALARLGLAWSELHGRHARLCQVAIVGRTAEPERSGHDLTYLAAAGLLSPPAMPRTLVADLAGAERAVAAAMALLLARERTGESGYAEIGLADLAQELAAPLRGGVTLPEGVLGGGFAGYALYRARDGWIALAALEPRFRERVSRLLGVPLDRAALERVFAQRTAVEWDAWGRENDVPLAALAS